MDVGPLDIDYKVFIVDVYRLLLCAGQLSPGAMHLLRQNNIGVIKVCKLHSLTLDWLHFYLQLIPKDTLIAIAQTNRAYPFSNALEMVC